MEEDEREGGYTQALHGWNRRYQEQGKARGVTSSKAQGESLICISKLMEIGIILSHALKRSYSTPALRPAPAQASCPTCSSPHAA